MWVPNQIKLPHSPVQRVPKWIWIPLHYLTWSIKCSPCVRHWGTPDSECCARQQEQYLQHFHLPWMPSWGGWGHSPYLGNDGWSKEPLPLPKGKMKEKEAQEIKSLNSSSTEDCLPDPDLILTHKQALLTAVTPGLGLQESTKQVINFAHISYAIRLCTLWAPAALALKL